MSYQFVLSRWSAFTEENSTVQRDIINYGNICWHVHHLQLSLLNCVVELYSFGGVNDQCGATSWAVQDPTGMLALLSCLCCHGDSDCNKTQIINFHLYIIQLW